MGFQSCSKKMTVSAPVRLRPSPPTCVVSRRTSTEGSPLNLVCVRVYMCVCVCVCVRACERHTNHTMTQVAHSNSFQALSGDQEMGTGISCKKDSQVAGLIHTHTGYWRATSTVSKGQKEY